TGAVSAWTPSVSTTTPKISPPANLRGTVVSSTALSISWDFGGYGDVQLERSTDGVNFSLLAASPNITEPYADSGLPAATTFYYRIRSFLKTTGGTFYSDYAPTITLATQAPPPPPSGTFTSTDIGNASPAGSTSVSNGLFTIRGAGDDIWNGADAFQYYYRPWTGDGVFIVRVTAIDYTADWAKAGIMIRADLTPGSVHVTGCASPAHNSELEWRATPGGATTGASDVNTADKAMPMWLKLTRDGDNFAFDISPDGTAWKRVGTTTVSMAANVYVGLAVTSHANGTLCTATLDNFNLMGGNGPSGLAGLARSPSQIDLRWVDNDLDETGFELERSVDGTNFTRIATPAANITTYSDTAVTAGTSYTYRVRSVSNAGPSGYSNTVTIAPEPAPPAGWSAQDIGTPAASGSSTGDGTTFTIRGSGLGVGGIYYHRESEYKGDFGSDVPGWADEFQYCWHPWTGEDDKVARVVSLAGS